MSTKKITAPPVKVELYEHQIAAFLYVLGLFDAWGENVAKGGDANERFHG